VAFAPTPLAVGGPGPILEQGWDIAPLVLAVMLALLMRWARIPLRTGALLAAALLGGMALDLVGDVAKIPLGTTIAVATLGFALVALKRTRRA
jgi:hypothetical protein